MVHDEKSPGLIPLKDLVPLRPWRNRTAPFPANGSVRYMKVKEPLFKDGSGVFWRLKNLEEESEDLEFEIPYEGLFEFIQNRVIKTIQRWIDKLLGPMCGQPMPD